MYFEEVGVYLFGDLRGGRAEYEEFFSRKISVPHKYTAEKRHKRELVTVETVDRKP